MEGWIVPPPREPVKSKEELERERRPIRRETICQVLYVPLRGRYG